MINQIDEYYEDVRREIGVEFGLEAGGYKPSAKPALTATQLQMMANAQLVSQCPNCIYNAEPQDKICVVCGAWMDTFVGAYNTISKRYVKVVE